MKIAIRFTLSMLLVFSGCGVKVHSTFDRSKDFSKYKTFCWLNGCEFTYSGPTYLNDSLLRVKIKNAIVSELERKGIVQNDNSPDLLVDFHISIKNESSVIYHRHEDGQYDFKPFPDQQVINYLKGTIVVDMVDQSHSSMVWRSEAIGYMDLHPDLSEENIKRGIRTALKDFPPKPLRGRK